MRWILRLAPVLAVFWLLLSGHYTPLLIALGALSVAVVTWIGRRAEIVDHEGIPLHISRRMPGYLLWLAKEILFSSLAVARQVWWPRRELRPAVGLTSASGLSPLSQVVYANSITLTPGTLSMSVGEEGIEVHSLRASAISDLQAGAMLDRVRRLETR